MPAINLTARSTGQLIIRAGRKPKLSAEQRLFAAILFLKKVGQARVPSLTDRNDNEQKGSERPR